MSNIHLCLVIQIRNVHERHLEIVRHSSPRLTGTISMVSYKSNYTQHQPVAVLLQWQSHSDILVN